MEIYELIQVTQEFVLLKFQDSVKASTLVNANFTLRKESGATPGLVADPFKTIDLHKDYRSVSKTLYLRWNRALEANTEYKIITSNIQNAFDSSIYDPDEFTFETLGTPQTPCPVQPGGSSNNAYDEPIIQDFSIKDLPTLNVGGTSTPGTPIIDPDTNIKLVSITPSLEDSYYLEPNEYAGCITIVFNKVLAANFVTPTEFNLQKKLVGSGPSKWESVDTEVNYDGRDPKVYIFLPSQDATPTYSYVVNNDAKMYWEAGYKYRLIISKNAVSIHI